MKARARDKVEALCEVDEDPGNLAAGSSPEYDRSHLSELPVDAYRVEPQRLQHASDAAVQTRDDRADRRSRQDYRQEGSLADRQHELQHPF